MLAGSNSSGTVKTKLINTALAIGTGLQFDLA